MSAEEKTEEKKDFTPITFFVTFEVKVDRVEEFMTIINEMIFEARKTEGILRYDFIRDPENPGKYACYPCFKAMSDVMAWIATDCHKKFDAFKESGGLTLESSTWHGFELQDGSQEWAKEVDNLTK